MERIPTDQPTKARMILPLSGLQDYLSLGYLLLLILGLVREVIYYGFLGINILEYDSIQDVLLSPLVFLVSKWVVPLILIALTMGSIFFIQYAAKQNAKKKATQNEADSAPQEEATKDPVAERINGVIIAIVILIIPFFMGSGIGSGSKVAERIESGDVKMNRVLYFQDDQEQAVYLIGQNSEYLFYVAEGDSTITITPIEYNIKMIKEIPKAD